MNQFMQISFTYHKKKVIQALRHYFMMRKEIRTMIILVNVFSILAAVLFFIHKISPFTFLVGTLMWLVLMIMFWFIMPFMVYKRTPMFTDTFSIVFNDVGIDVTNNKGSIEWRWNAFSAYKESPHFFYLYFNGRSFFLIPKDDLNVAEMDEMRSLLKTKIITT